MSATAVARTSTVTVRAAEAHRPVSPLLFGLFYEDINLSGDGGLNANLVNNHSFEGVYVDPGTANWHTGG
ncbi:hypothetical protein [Humibacillus xanthopallidus]|uniref:hypothetical protein n=1 Tax=Humibacillus xanthopallidus TaxID=412689 RepID=UPI00115081CA|nr:hypothetical protein [Humibacillus xanthopallidus]